MNRKAQIYKIKKLYSIKVKTNKIAYISQSKLLIIHCLNPKLLNN